MNTEPLSVAVRAIAETRQLLESLLISSESFRYKEARLALVSLNRKARQLAKLQSRLQNGHKRRSVQPANVCFVDFKNSAAKGSHAR